MSLNWIKELYDTYENNLQFVGKEVDGNLLLPVSFTWVNAQIECVLNEDGTLYHAEVIDKANAATMIPCTIESANRTSLPVAHPLFDKLSYIAKELHCEHKGTYLYDDYRNKLKNWSMRPDAPECLRILYRYLEQGTLIQDLVNRNILAMENGKLIEKWKDSSKEKPLLFKVLSGEQKSAVVRFSIYYEKQGKIDAIWLNEQVQASYLSYYSQAIDNKNLCMITGEEAPITDLHSAYLRFPGDSAKLISSLDKLGFKYKGRNETAEEAVSVSYEASQKAHNALKWLIQRQGFKHNGFVILAWGTKQVDIPRLTEGSYAIFHRQEKQIPYTYKEYARELKLVLSGIYQDCFSNVDQDIVVMSLDAATKGRLAILFYQTLNGSQFLERIKQWYQTLSWTSMFYFAEDRETGKKRKIYYTGTPSFTDIVNALYGNVDSDDIQKIKKNAYTQLLSCMIDGTRLPEMYASILLRKFCNPNSFDNAIQIRDFTGVACAIIRKYRNDLNTEEEEEWKVDVDYSQKQTYYLWGRLLALADWLEQRANEIAKEERMTNATRYRKEFSKNPAKTWFMLMERIEPYKRKFRRANKDEINELQDIEMKMNEIMALLEIDEENDGSLDDRFILGYGAQLNELNAAYRRK